MGKTYQHKGDCGIECDDYLGSQCIIHDEALTFLGLESGASMKEVVQKLMLALQNSQNEVNLLKQRVTDLETP